MTNEPHPISTKPLGHDRLEIQMSHSTSDSPKPSDRFDNSETKIRNRETCLQGGFTVATVVYRAASVDHRYNGFIFYCICETM